MRRPGWHRIGASETRMLRDLKKFTANTDDFKFMRNVVDSIVNAGSGTESQSGKSKAGSENQPATPSACIPFIGRFYSSFFHPFFAHSFSRHIPNTASSS